MPNKNSNADFVFHNSLWKINDDEEQMAIKGNNHRTIDEQWTNNGRTRMTTATESEGVELEQRANYGNKLKRSERKTNK